MKSYTNLRNLYGTYTNNTQSGNLTNGDQYINDSIRDLLGDRDWPFLETSDATNLTVGSQQFYVTPADLDKLIDVTVTIGSVLWKPTEESNRDKWDRLNYAQGVTSTYPQRFYVYAGQVGFWPKPSSSGNVITYNYKMRVTDLVFPDYTTGSVLTATQGSTTIVGASTSWTTPMAGMYIRATFPTNADPNKGDGAWYKIASIQSGTQMTLVAPYKGVGITAGTATYLIGQMPVLPENYQIMPVYWAAANYWRLNGNNIEKAEQYEKLFNEKKKLFEKDFGEKSTNPMIDAGVGERPVTNPNLTVTY